MLLDAGANIDEKPALNTHFPAKYNISPLGLAIAQQNLIATEILVNLGAGQHETFLIDMSFSFEKKFIENLDQICTVRILERGVVMGRVFERDVIKISLRPQVETPASCCTIS